MPRNSTTGVYSLPTGNPVVTGTIISTTWANTTLTDIATALTGSVAADGSVPMTGNLLMNGTGAIKVPEGVTSQRPATPRAGMIRMNDDSGQFEGYFPSGTWAAIGGGATGAGGDQVFVENARIVTANYTFTTGKSAESVGPISINTGISVTVPTGQRWVIL